MKRKIGIGKGSEERVHRKYRFYSYIKKIFHLTHIEMQIKIHTETCP